MSIGKWVPSNLRVRREDGRVFSNSIGASRSHGLKIARQIEHCCNGYILEAGGWGWKWDFSEIEHDFGDFDVLRDKIRAATINDREHVLAKRNYYKNGGKASSPAYRQRSFVVVSFLRDWIQGFRPMNPEDDGYRIPIAFSGKQLYKELQKYCDNNMYDIPFKSSRGFSKHLRAWELLYQRVVGLKFGSLEREYSSIVGIGFDSDLTVEDASIYDYIPEYGQRKDRKKGVPVRPGARGFPVHCKNNGITYPSIRIASAETLIHRDDIKFCCEGDVDYAEGAGVVWRFSYGKWEDVSVDWFVEKSEWNRVVEFVTVEDLNDGSMYPSIVEAAAVLGINDYEIKEFCENPVEKGMEVTYPFSAPEWHNFEYVLEEW